MSWWLGSPEASYWKLVYSRGTLLAIRKTVEAGIFHHIPKELRRRYCGGQDEVKLKVKWMASAQAKPPMIQTFNSVGPNRKMWIRWTSWRHSLNTKELPGKQLEHLNRDMANYQHTMANAETVCKIMSNTSLRIQAQHPDAFFVISGDFNHVTLDYTLSAPHQYVNWTRKNKTVNLLYANTREAYTAPSIPPLGKSDHNLDLL